MTAENVQSLPPEEQTGLTRRRTRGGAFALAFLAAFFSALLSVVLGMGLAMAVVENSARFVPSYEKTDLTPYLEKETLSEEDYELLYHQTGLTRLGVDALEDRSELLDYQENFFFEGVRAHSMAAVTTPRCVLQTEEGADFYAKLVPLQEGDILVTSTCHTFGWRNGHAAIVVDAESRRVLEATGPGCNSTLGTANWFAHGANFMVLRLKGASQEERKEIASWAGNNLRGIEYSLFTGFFNAKDQSSDPKTTHCSHLVWQAYKAFGYDIDSDGGPLVTCNDIARSELLEVVQVYGFDPDALW